MDAREPGGKCGLPEPLMAIPVWTELTWEELRDLDRARSVAVLPVGAVEAHGPHLPLGTDIVIAEAMAREGAARIGERGFQAVLLPSVSFTAAPFAAAFPGTLAISAETVTALLLDLARELTRQEFAALAVANAHLDPIHRRALAQAAERARGAGLLPVVVPDLARKPWALRLTEEFRTGACHAGRFEGSIVMAERPALVRRSIQDALPANPASLSEAIRAGATTFEGAGGPRAYFGWPADATAEEGRATVEELGRILRDAVLEALRPERAA
jgi:creatinine amidohydrolase